MSLTCVYISQQKSTERINLFFLFLYFLFFMSARLSLFLSSLFRRMRSLLRENDHRTFSGDITINYFIKLFKQSWAGFSNLTDNIIFPVFRSCSFRYENFSSLFVKEEKGKQKYSTLLFALKRNKC